mmetsp:Transcript_36132/g.103939  ORF Transcript_36132/g.103939 Transcript_36132/m.103939 type:complete len:252 (+) Transcript_36132:458-1213(+)
MCRRFSAPSTPTATGSSTSRRSATTSCRSSASGAERPSTSTKSSRAWTSTAPRPSVSQSFVRRPLVLCSIAQRSRLKFERRPLCSRCWRPYAPAMAQTSRGSTSASYWRVRVLVLMVLAEGLATACMRRSRSNVTQAFATLSAASAMCRSRRRSGSRIFMAPPRQRRLVPEASAATAHTSWRPASLSPTSQRGRRGDRKGPAPPSQRSKRTSCCRLSAAPGHGWVARSAAAVRFSGKRRPGCWSAAVVAVG